MYMYNNLMCLKRPSLQLSLRVELVYSVAGGDHYAAAAAAAAAAATTVSVSLCWCKIPLWLVYLAFSSGQLGPGQRYLVAKRILCQTISLCRITHDLCKQAPKPTIDLRSWRACLIGLRGEPRQST